jgi:hypothetical protein
LEISSLIIAAEKGHAPAGEELFAALYSELHRLAKRELARCGFGVSLSSTTLLHEAYLDMAAREGPSFPEMTSLDTQVLENAVDHRQLVQISDALDELGKAEPALAEIVDLKFFCGFSFAEIAAMRDVSERTVQRNWEKARIYLHRKIRSDLIL